MTVQFFRMIWPLSENNIKFVYRYVFVVWSITVKSKMYEQSEESLVIVVSAEIFETKQP